MDSLPDYKLQWVRPTDIPFPNVWYRFEAKSKDSSRSYKIRIEDVTPDRHTELCELYMNNYYTEEPLCQSLNICTDKEWVMWKQWTRYQLMNQNINLIAVLDNEDMVPELIGSLSINVISRGDPELPPCQSPGDAGKKLDEFYKNLKAGFNPFELLESDHYFRDNGCVVKSKFSGLNVGFNLFSSLEKMAKTFGIRGAMYSFTNIRSQIIAKRLGFKIIREINFSEYVDEQGRTIFPVEIPKSGWYAYIKYF